MRSTSSRWQRTPGSDPRGPRGRNSGRVEKQAHKRKKTKKKKKKERKKEKKKGGAPLPNSRPKGWQPRPGWGVRYLHRSPHAPPLGSLAGSEEVPPDGCENRRGETLSALTFPRGSVSLTWVLSAGPHRTGCGEMQALIPQTRWNQRM